MKQPNKPHHESWEEYQDEVEELLVSVATYTINEDGGIEIDLAEARDVISKFISQTRKEALSEFAQRVKEEVIGKDGDYNTIAQEAVNELRKQQRKALDELVKEI